MPVIRIIQVTFPPEQAARAERNWKESCAPILIRHPGCMRAEMLRGKENPGEYISYSEWNSQESIQKYLQSEDHLTIKQHNQNIDGAQVVIKHYELVS